MTPGVLLLLLTLSSHATSYSTGSDITQRKLITAFRVMTVMLIAVPLLLLLPPPLLAGRLDTPPLRAPDHLPDVVRRDGAHVSDEAPQRGAAVQDPVVVRPHKQPAGQRGADHGRDRDAHQLPDAGHVQEAEAGGAVLGGRRAVGAILGYPVLLEFVPCDGRQRRTRVRREGDGEQWGNPEMGCMYVLSCGGLGLTGELIDIHRRWGHGGIPPFRRRFARAQRAGEDLVPADVDGFVVVRVRARDAPVDRDRVVHAVEVGRAEVDAVLRTAWSCQRQRRRRRPACSIGAGAAVDGGVGVDVFALGAAEVDAQALVACLAADGSDAGAR